MHTDRSRATVCVRVGGGPCGGGGRTGALEWLAVSDVSQRRVRLAMYSARTVATRRAACVHAAHDSVGRREQQARRDTGTKGAHTFARGCPPPLSVPSPGKVSPRLRSTLPAPAATWCTADQRGHSHTHHSRSERRMAGAAKKKAGVALCAGGGALPRPRTRAGVHGRSPGTTCVRSPGMLAGYVCSQT